MTQVTALQPGARGVAVHAALTAEADRLVASGDPRIRGQMMANTLVGRVTGAPSIDGRPVVPVTIDVVMIDRALFAAATDSARCPTGCHIGCRWRNDVSAAASAGACVSASVWFAPSSITSSA